MNIKKITAAVLAAAVPVLSTASYASADNEQNNSTEAVAFEKTEAADTNDGELFKDETVYAIADASGEADKIIVSDWLKNPDALSQITDWSDLENIENVKGDETFTANSDETVWNANGSDIYYQGTTDKELPVDVKITYYLDGKEISANELAGKSGKVKIRFDYENKSKKAVEINGESTDIYTPFLMLSGTSLDSDKFTDIQITNGKIISDGKKCIAVGFALPGLKESLALSDDTAKDINIPDYVEITAEVTDFSLAGTVTVASSDVFNDLKLSNNSKLEDLTDPINKLNDAAEQLVSGSGKLYEGLDTLASKTGDLSDGISSLSAGADKLNSGSSSLCDGIVQINAGLKSSYDGAGKINDGLGNASSGAASVLAGCKSLSSGADTLSTGLLSAGNGLKSVSDGIDTAQQSLTKTISADESVLAGLKQMYAKNPDDTTAKMIKTLEASIAGQSKISDSMKSGNGGLRDGISTVQAGIGKLSDGANGLKTGIGTLQTGAEALKSGIETLSAGSTNLHDGLAKLVAAGNKAQSGALSLSQGSKTLYNGIGQFSNSSKDLIDAILQLRDGSKELNDGMIEFNESGIKKLSEVFDGDLKTLFDRINAVADAGREYTNFSGIADNMEGNVKIIIKTDEIK